MIESLYRVTLDVALLLVVRLEACSPLLPLLGLLSRLRQAESLEELVVRHHAVMVDVHHVNQSTHVLDLRAHGRGGRRGSR